MKVDKVVVKETKYISLAVITCSLIMQAVFLLAGKYDLTVFLGSVYGGLLAILNFLLLGITVQNATSIEDSKLAKKKIQLSYNMRLLGLVILAAIGAILPFFHFLPVILSLLFPRIYYLLVPLFRKELRKDKGEGENG